MQNHERGRQEREERFIKAWYLGLFALSLVFIIVASKFSAM